MQELIEEVFLGYDKTKGASYLIWQLVSVLEDSTKWQELDRESQRCLIDHHLSWLLNCPLLTDNWVLWYGIVETELYRSGCVLQRTTSDTALQENIDGCVVGLVRLLGSLLSLDDDCQKCLVLLVWRH